VVDYAIYSHILCSYQGRELTQKEKEKAKKITLLFLLNDAFSLLDHLKNIEKFDKVNAKNKLDEFSSFCDIVFFIPDHSAFNTRPGIFNKIFYCLDQLSHLEKVENTKTIRDKLYLQIKDKISQNKLDLSIMEKKLSPYDKKDPDFSLPSFIKYLRAFSKKLCQLSFVFLEKYLDDKAVYSIIYEKREYLSLIFGRKKINELLLRKSAAVIQKR
jgi:hypothetical protein